MSKTLALLAVVLVVVALPAAAQQRCTTGGVPSSAAGEADLAWLDQPLVVALAPGEAPPEGVPAASGGSSENLTCYVTEDCNELPDISCSGTVCSAVSRNCAGYACQRGSVTCNGVTTQCSQVCPPNCSFFECRQACKVPGCVGVCLDTCTCECETICQ